MYEALMISDQLPLELPICKSENVFDGTHTWFTHTLSHLIYCPWELIISKFRFWCFSFFVWKLLFFSKYFPFSLHILRNNKLHFFCHVTEYCWYIKEKKLWCLRCSWLRFYLEGGIEKWLITATLMYSIFFSVHHFFMQWNFLC